MSLELALIAASFGVAIAVGLVHFYDRFAQRGMYRRALSRAEGLGERVEAIAGALPSARMALEKVEKQLESLASLDGVSGALSGLDERLDAILGVLTSGMEKAAKAEAEVAAAVDAAKHFGGLPPEVAGSLGGTTTWDRKAEREVQTRLGQDLLGAYGGLIAQFAPSLHEWLLANPDRIVQTMELPVVRRILGNVQRFASSVTGKETQQGGGVDWSRLP